MTFRGLENLVMRLKGMKSRRGFGTFPQLPLSGWSKQQKQPLRHGSRGLTRNGIYFALNMVDRALNIRPILRGLDFLLGGAYAGPRCFYADVLCRESSYPPQDLGTYPFQAAPNVDFGKDTYSIDDAFSHRIYAI